MENPYAAPEVTPELAKEERQRPKMWRGLLVAYGVHHLFALLGLIAGLVAFPSEWNAYFPREPLPRLMTLVLTPLLDFLLLVDPFLKRDMLQMETFMGLRLLRSALVLTVPAAGLAYALWRRRSALWYLGVISFLLFLSLVASDATDRKTLDERISREGDAKMEADAP